MTKKEVIYFDMGNTLLDFHIGLSDVEKDAIGLKKMADYLGSKGYELNEADFTHFLNASMVKRIRTLKEVSFETYLKSVGIPEHLIIEALSVYYQPYMSAVVIHEGALDVLKHFKGLGYKIGVISNCYLPSLLYKTVFKDLGLDDYIDGYTFSYDTIHRKPSSVIYQAALDLFNIEGHQAVMIGDGFVPDVEGGSKMGLDVIWYNYKGKPATAEIKILKTITHLNELLNIKEFC